MKNVIFLISADCSVKDLPPTVEKIISTMRGSKLKFYLNIPIEILAEKGFNFGIQKGIDEIAQNNLTYMVENEQCKVLPSAYDLSYYQCFPVSSFESKFEKLKNAIDKDKMLSKLVNYSFQAPFQTDYFRKEFDTEYFKFFTEYILGIVKKSNKLYIALKSKNETFLYYYVSLYNVVKGVENELDLPKKLKNSISNYSFIHLVVKSLSDVDVLLKSLPILENLVDQNKIAFGFDYKSFLAPFKQILSMDVLYPLNNLDYKLSPSFFKESSYVFNTDDDRYKRSFNTSHSERINRVTSKDESDIIDQGNDSIFFNMSGEMKLEDELVFLNFLDGQIHDIKFKNEKVFQKVSCYSNIVYQKVNYKFKPTVSLVVEKYNTRSFRAVYSISGKYINQPGVITLDYSFIDGFYYPIIKIEINYPIFEQDVYVTEFNPYVLSVSFSKIFLKDFSLTTLYPDQSSGFHSVKNLSTIRTLLFNKEIDLYEGVMLGNAYLVKNRERSFLIFSIIDGNQVVSPLYYNVKSRKKLVSLDLHLGKRFKNIQGSEFEKLEKEVSYFCICPNQSNFSVLENLKDEVKKELKNI